MLGASTALLLCMRKEKFSMPKRIQVASWLVVAVMLLLTLVPLSHSSGRDKGDSHWPSSSVSTMVIGAPSAMPSVAEGANSQPHQVWGASLRGSGAQLPLIAVSIPPTDTVPPPVGV